MTLVDQILAVFEDKPLTLADIGRRTGLPSVIVNKTVSSMVTRTRKLRKLKVPGMYSTYEPIVPELTAIPESVVLKLAQLVTNRDQLRKAGLSLVDAIIIDYQRFKDEP